MVKSLGGEIMKNKAQTNIAVLLLLAVGVIVGLVLLTETANQQKVLTDKRNVVDELVNIATARNATGGGINVTLSNFTITNAPSGWKVTECPISSITYGNSTTDFVLDTDYKFYSSSGILQILPTADTNYNKNLTYIDYSYCLDGYNTDSGSRTVGGMITLFAGLALVIWLIGYGVKEWMN